MAKVYLLNEQKFENVENLEVFKIEYLDFSVDLTKYDALVFTSKNAIYSINKQYKSWVNINSYVIASKTAQIAKKFGSNVVFVGESGHGDDFAYELISHLKNKKVLYVKAMKNVSNLSAILKDNGVLLDEVVAYKTSCNDFQKTNLEENSIIIFTSPSTVECFFKKYSWDSSFKAVVIGKTTASYLPSGVDYQISKKTDVKECVKLALENLKHNFKNF